MFTGKRQVWEKIGYLGSGDSGELYSVRGQHTGEIGVLKHPGANEIDRQALEIECEGEILHRLISIRFVERGEKNWELAVRAVRLLDSAPSSFQQTREFFVVTELAPGFDFLQLQKIRENPNLAQGKHPFLDAFTHLDSFPSLLLCRAAYGVARYLESIHQLRADLQTDKIKGIIWNDVKPEHIFWNPEAHEFVLIDWAHSQFLGKDGVSSDRLYSIDQDWEQLVKMFRGYFDKHGKAIRPSIDWPAKPTWSSDWSLEIGRLMPQFERVINAELQGLSELRNKEETVLRKEFPSSKDLYELDEIHSKLISYGEVNITSGMGMFLENMLASSLEAGNFVDYLRAYSLAREVPGINLTQWDLMEQIARSSIHGELGEQYERVKEAVYRSDWHSVLWLLGDALPDNKDEWYRLSRQVRNRIDTVRHNPETPLDVLRDLQSSIGKQYKSLEGIPDRMFEMGMLEMKQKRLAEVDQAWSARFGGIDYTNDIELVRMAMTDYPEHWLRFDRAITPPNQQAKRLLGNWEKRSFKDVERALEDLMIWDPDRRRIWGVKKHVENVQTILEEIRGTTTPEKAEALRLRMLEMQDDIGQAQWLDRNISALKELSAKGKEGFLHDTGRSYEDVFEWVRDYNPPREIEYDTWDDTSNSVAEEFHAYLREWKLDEARKLARMKLRRWDEAYSTLVDWMEIKNCYQPLTDFNVKKKSLLDKSPKEDIARIKEALSIVEDIQVWRTKLEMEGISYSKQFLNVKKNEKSNWILLEDLYKVYEIWWKLSVEREFNYSNWVTLDADFGEGWNDYAGENLREAIDLVQQARKRWISLPEDTPLSGASLEGISAALRSSSDSLAAWREQIKAAKVPPKTDFPPQFFCPPERYFFPILLEFKTLQKKIANAATLAGKSIEDMRNWKENEKNGNKFSFEKWKEAYEIIDELKNLEILLIASSPVTDGWYNNLNLVSHKKEGDPAITIELNHPLFSWLNDYPGKASFLYSIKKWLESILILLRNQLKVAFNCCLILILVGCFFLGAMFLRNLRSSSTPNIPNVDTERTPHSVTNSTDFPKFTSTPPLQQELPGSPSPEPTTMQATPVAPTPSPDISVLANQGDLLEVAADYYSTGDTVQGSAILRTWLENKEIKGKFPEIQLENLEQGIRLTHWLRVTQAICEVTTVPGEAINLKSFRSYLDWHIEQYNDGKNVFGILCSQSFDSYQSRLSFGQDKVLKVNLINSNWVEYQKGNDCFYRQSSSMYPDISIGRLFPLSSPSSPRCLLPDNSQFNNPDQKPIVLGINILPGDSNENLFLPMYVFIRLTQENTGVEFELHLIDRGIQSFSIYSVKSGLRAYVPNDNTKPSILSRDRPWNFSILVVGRLVIWRNSPSETGIPEPLPVLAGLLPRENAKIPIVPAFGFVSENGKEISPLIFQKLYGFFVRLRGE